MIKWKKLYTIIALSLLILLYIMIFFLSSENGDQSSDISMRVTRAFWRIYYKIAGGGEGPVVEYTVSSTEGFIRKLAHFIEYAGVGFLSYSIVVTWYGTVRKGQLLVVIQLFVSAGLDEIHQYFVPGRNAAFTDVLLDTAGGIAGMGIILAGIFIFYRYCTPWIEEHHLRF